jgi:putative membrane protein
MHYLRIGIVALMAGLGSLACSGEGSPSSEVSGATEFASANDDPKNPKGDPDPKRDKEERLTDLQIANVLHVVNQGEIKEARFALKRATWSDVREFASRMEIEHTKADEMLRALFGDAMETTDLAIDDTSALASEGDPPPDRDVPRASSQISRLFKRQTVLDLQQLRGIEPPDFDLGYITKQVAAHAGVLAVIDQKLMPSVKMRDLRELMEKMRPAVVSHLESATAITETIIDEHRKAGKGGKDHPHVN